MNPIGIMQGRLLPAVNGRIQSFPKEDWRWEFALAKEAGLACIEWIYEVATEKFNPLQTDEGIAEIRTAVDSSGVAVRSVCADYYMCETLVTADGSLRAQVVEHLAWLLGQASKVGVRYMVIPCVDSSSLKSREEITGFKTAVKSLIPHLERARVELHLETDLRPVDLVDLLQSINHPLVRANYDIGNSASLGRDPNVELTLLARWLGSVHVKDRLKGGHTVPLGTGDADFRTCFRLINAAGFKGAFILQAARESGLSELDLAKRNRQFVETHLFELSPA
jgi:hexulose-6-phosphate isomerase